MITVYPVLPVSAPRQVKRDKWNPSDHVKRYRAFRDELRWRGCTIPEPFHHALFVLPIPPSWSLKKQRAREGMPHQQRPDRDNLEKALLDAVYGEDCQVWDGRTTKLWGRRGLVLLSAEPVGVVLPFDLEPYYAAAHECDSTGVPRMRVAPLLA